jgi:hypothetical protein
MVTKNYTRFIIISLMVLSLFSVLATAKVYVVGHDSDDTVVYDQLKTYRTSQGVEALSSQMQAMQDDMFLYKVNEYNRYKNLRDQFRDSFKEDGAWHVTGNKHGDRHGKDHGQDNDCWSYDAAYVKVGTDHEFFRFFKNCDSRDNGGVYNDWNERNYLFTKKFTHQRRPIWWQDMDFYKRCWRASNYQEYTECQKAHLPTYNLDWPRADLVHDGTTNYGRNAYVSWANKCGAESQRGIHTNWCRTRQPWMVG